MRLFISPLFTTPISPRRASPTKPTSSAPSTLHHAAFRLGVKRVVSASSNAAVGWSYGERFVPDYPPIDEDHPLKQERVYGLSKEIGETIARSYARKEVETVSLRPSGVVTSDELEQIPSSIADRWLGLVQPGVEIRIGLSLRYWSC